MSSELIIREIQAIVNSGSVNTNCTVITALNPNSFIFSWKLSNEENLGSSYFSKIDNLEIAENVIKHFFENDKDTLISLKKHSNFSEEKDLYLHLYLNV